MREGDETGSMLARRGGRGQRLPDSHYRNAVDELSRLLVELAEEGRDRLPAEAELSEVLGFSRPTIRSALLSLEKEGKVQRLHGVGTLINRHAVRIKANLVEDRPFLEVLAALGYEPSADILRMEERGLPDEVADRLGVERRSPGCVISRLFRASGRPGVYSQDFVPTSLVTEDFDRLAAESSTFAFIDRWTPHAVRYSVADLVAVSADEVVGDALELPVGSAVVGLDLLHIDERDARVGVTHACINDRILRFSIVRTNWTV